MTVANLTRYHFHLDLGELCLCKIINSADGEYVKFSDVEALLSASTNVAMPNPENFIGACDGCKYDLPDGSEHCNDCCRNESLSDCYSSPASA